MMPDQVAEHHHALAGSNW